MLEFVIVTLQYLLFGMWRGPGYVGAPGASRGLGSVVARRSCPRPRGSSGSLTSFGVALRRLLEFKDQRLGDAKEAADSSPVAGGGIALSAFDETDVSVAELVAGFRERLSETGDRVAAAAPDVFVGGLLSIALASFCVARYSLLVTSVSSKRGTINAQDRVTLDPRPDIKLPLPNWIADRYRLDDRGHLVPVNEVQAHELVPADLEESSYVEAAKTTGESYLELAAVDLDNVGEIIDYASRYGTLGIRRDDWHGLKYQRWARSLLPELERIARDQLGDAYDDERHYHRETLAEFRFGARLMRDLVELVRVVYQGEKPPRAELLVISRPRSRRDALKVVAEIVTTGLGRFQPRLAVTTPAERAPRLTEPERGRRWSFGCLELYNHIVEHAKYRTCANETCGRYFVRQSGRAKMAQHRTVGVAYCSESCARAQTQRTYRRRKRGASRG
jgi:hypothetical protein